MLGRIPAVLDAVSATAGISRGELARRTGLAPATGNRIVARLIAARRLIDGPAGPRLGLRLFELGVQAGRAGGTLLDIAGPYPLDPHAVLGWTTRLGVLDDAAVWCLMKGDAHRRPRLDTRVAGRSRRRPSGAPPGSRHSTPAQDREALGRCSAAAADPADQAKFTSLHHM